MGLNRDVQRSILSELADCYPDAYGHPIQNLAPNADEGVIVANLIYLAEHGLLKHGLEEDVDGWSPVLGMTRITARGMDFLEDDGGLSAILGVVTIRLHSDTIKGLIEEKIAQSDLAPADKKRWIDQLRSLPADATKHLVQKLVEKGLDSGPAAVAAVGAFLKSQGLW
ncbi:hypothetical protein [Achromobacter insolitus]|uniref:hypothetical protein n=1 Tax=Achromobacter insolitus TaxID=217204 RepID=UPI0027E08D10|nr:hypothetical protein [Achromobacter insolitus]MDQ6212340.1 hypothetical protein [Achromobacter insolitus]